MTHPTPRHPTQLAITLTLDDRAVLAKRVRRQGYHLNITTAYAPDGYPEMAEVRTPERATDSLAAAQRSRMLGGVKKLTGMNGRLASLIHRDAKTGGIVIAEADGPGSWRGADMETALRDWQAGFPTSSGAAQ